MSPRQARRERREAGRKAKKAEWKRLKGAGCDPIPHLANAGQDNYPTAPSIDAELEEEFSPELIAEARAVRERIHQGIISRRDSTACLAADSSGFVSQSAPKQNRDRECPLGQAERSRREINRANAQYSTGPRSRTGKLASSGNALRHGLASGTLVIPGEDPAAFEALKTALIEEHQPATETEILLLTQMAQSWWLMQRAIRLQNNCFAAERFDN